MRIRSAVTFHKKDNLMGAKSTYINEKTKKLFLFCFVFFPKCT